MVCRHLPIWYTTYFNTQCAALQFRRSKFQSQLIARKGSQPAEEAAGDRRLFWFLIPIWHVLCVPCRASSAAFSVRPSHGLLSFSSWHLFHKPFPMIWLIVEQLRAINAFWRTKVWNFLSWSLQLALPVSIVLRFFPILICFSLFLSILSFLTKKILKSGIPCVTTQPKDRS